MREFSSQYKKNNGFTFMGLLFVLMLIGINLALAGTLYTFAQQREKERQLIFIGEQFKQAIKRYYVNSPGTVKRYPPNLESLLLDNRFVNTKRHLRRVYLDPFTKTNEWGLVESPQGGIMGVYSLSESTSLKYTNFGLRNPELENKKYYKDWQFIYSPIVNKSNVPKPVGK
jgi:type II secretory pathway pseudopilin PulG